HGPRSPGGLGACEFIADMVVRRLGRIREQAGLFRLRLAGLRVGGIAPAHRANGALVDTFGGEVIRPLRGRNDESGAQPGLRYTEKDVLPETLSQTIG